MRAKSDKFVYKFRGILKVSEISRFSFWIKTRYKLGIKQINEIQKKAILFLST